jgi:hypothetical protein
MMLAVRLAFWLRFLLVPPSKYIEQNKILIYSWRKIHWRFHLWQIYVFKWSKNKYLAHAQYFPEFNIHPPHPILKG